MNANTWLPAVIRSLLLLRAGCEAIGIGEAWRVPTYNTKSNYFLDHSFWPRLDSSAFEVRTVSGVGRLAPFDESPNQPKENKNGTSGTKETDSLASLKRDKSDDARTFDDPRKSDDVEDSRIVRHGGDDERQNTVPSYRKTLRARIATTSDFEDSTDRKALERTRREAINETRMEKIASSKGVREARSSSYETWSKQPFSVEYRSSLDRLGQSHDDEEEPSTIVSGRSYQAPRTDFITSQYRHAYGENRESRDMPVTKAYLDDLDLPWYRNAIRERDFDVSLPRRDYSDYYRYPSRYRTEKDYYMRLPSDQSSYFYDRYRDDDLDLYGRSRPTPKPKRIIYYATLPEVVRKPVDLRNYPRSYDGPLRTVLRTGSTYERIPGNVDPSRYRYRHLYDGYDSYSKRSSFYDQPFPNYREDEARRKGSIKESLRDVGGFSASNDRNVANQLSTRDDGKLPWPVQIGTEVSVKDNERIPGRKIFGESSSYDRFQSAQLQKAPDTTDSSEVVTGSN